MFMSKMLTDWMTWHLTTLLRSRNTSTKSLSVAFSQKNLQSRAGKPSQYTNRFCSFVLAPYVLEKLLVVLVAVDHELRDLLDNIHNLIIVRAGGSVEADEARV